MVGCFLTALSTCDYISTQYLAKWHL